MSRAILSNNSDRDDAAPQPEVRLFRSVITRAFLDAYDGDLPGFTRLGRRPTLPAAPTSREAALRLENSQSARRWFQEGGEDFRTVCHAADLDPVVVQHRVLAVMRGEAVLLMS